MWIFQFPQRRPQIGFYPQIGGPQIGESTVKNFERNEKFTMIYFLNQSGPSWYMAKMPEVHHYHKVYEKTPSYTTLKRAPARIFNFDHKIKIIAILCDPGND